MDELPPTCDWGEYIDRWVADLGGWIQLADALIHRIGDRTEIAQDPGTVERGLRRLARRGHKSGGQYGRWMLRSFGFTSPIEQCVKWMGQYHTRFADLPCALRLDLLMLWNRPPVAESRLVGWILLGIASAHQSRLDVAECERWLRLADAQVAKGGAAAEIEAELLHATLDAATAEGRYARVEALLGGELAPMDRVVYRARLCDQRAQLLTRAETPDLPAARALYAGIVEHPDLPFVAFRKAVGLAYCAWKLGDVAEATRLAELAIDHAGDAGLVRMRIMALNMLSRVLTGTAAASVNTRARQMATQLEDEDLLRRVAFCAGPA